ncbi:MAG: flagellar basal body rod protein FlgC [Bdellovibrionales bacterium]
MDVRIETSLSGLNASAKALSAAANNIANAQTAGSLEDAADAPYTPVEVKTTAQGEGQGVTARTVKQDLPFVPFYNPDSPFANKDGYFGLPYVNLDEQLINAKTAQNNYEANAAVLKTGIELSDTLLNAVDKSA